MTDNAAPDGHEQDGMAGGYEQDGMAGGYQQDGSAAERETVGVGPHPLPWPDDDRLDPELLEHGDRRNVADRFRYWRLEAIRDELDHDAFPVEVAIENWAHSFNIGTVVRNANAFGVRRVHIVGRRRWNRRGAMVTDRYLHVQHHATVAGVLAHSGDRGLQVVAIDNVEGAQPIESVELPERALLLFGAEGPGLSAEAVDGAALVCSITMYGSTRSINAGVASGIALHSWVRQHAPRAR